MYVDIVISNVFDLNKHFFFSVGRQSRKGSEWWNEEVGRMAAEKRRTFEKWLQRRDRVTYYRYRAQRVAVKLAVQAAKRLADRRWGERLGNDFEGNKKMFWKEVKQVRKGEHRVCVL